MQQGLPDPPSLAELAARTLANDAPTWQQLAPALPPQLRELRQLLRYCSVCGSAMFHHWRACIVYGPLSPSLPGTLPFYVQLCSDRVRASASAPALRLTRAPRSILCDSSSGALRRPHEHRTDGTAAPSLRLRQRHQPGPAG